LFKCFSVVRVGVKCPREVPFMFCTARYRLCSLAARSLHLHIFLAKSVRHLHFWKDRSLHLHCSRRQNSAAPLPPCNVGDRATLKSSWERNCKNVFDRPARPPFAQVLHIARGGGGGGVLSPAVLRRRQYQILQVIYSRADSLSKIIQMDSFLLDFRTDKKSKVRTHRRGGRLHRAGRPVPCTARGRQSGACLVQGLLKSVQ